MIVQTITGKRGAVVDVSPPGTPPDQARVWVRLWLDIGPRWPNRPPARVVVAYAPQDVVEVRGQPNER